MTKRILGCMAFAGLALAFPASARGSEDLTWGAVDPSWSPDGKELAFSLFGTIWRMPASGGVASQVTVSPGYHAHPAWSPAGDAIVFVSGGTPGKRLPLVSGQLMLVDVATGRERPLRTPYPTAGAPAWSPDGRKIVCGLAATAQAASLLHEIAVADGSVRRLQVPAIVHVSPNRTVAGPWIDAAWNPKRREIYFVANRGASPQVWSMDPGNPRIQIQLPLTRYRREDVALPQGISALPDGSGVVYAAAVINRQGNYELFRVGRDGGAPVALTDTARDEFSPAVSPDGKWIAHVSNRLGNADLFLMPADGGPKKHVRISGLRFRRSSGRVRLKVMDENGSPAAARIFVHASDGRAYCPAGTPIYYLSAGAHSPGDGFFLGSGDDTLEAPAGVVRISVVRGFEYEVSGRTVEVRDGGSVESTIQMQRWANWKLRGWHSGENHFHANYNGLYYQTPAAIKRWMEAEDLNVANMVFANSEGSFMHDREFFTGVVDPGSDSSHVLRWGEEYRNDYVLGHLAFLGIERFVPPFFSSVIGSASPYDFPLNTTAALEAKRQGGFVTQVHPAYDGFEDVFDTWYGAKELPVSAALGAVDSIDVLPTSGPAFEMWYALLNSGFKIPAGAGTDSFANWRNIHHTPGAARIYIHTGAPLTWERWISRYREGRTFVTTGPLLTFNVNGISPGGEIRVAPGRSLRMEISAEALSGAPLRRIEIVLNGNVIKAGDAAPGQRTIRLKHDLRVADSCWLAARVVGEPLPGTGSRDSQARAHSSPVYVTVADRPTLLAEDIERMIRWVDRLWALLEERNNYGGERNRAEARRMILQARDHFSEKLARAR